MFSREAEAGHSSFFFLGGGLLLSPEAATHIPGQPWSYAACAWIIYWHSSPGRLVHSAPWEGAAHGASSLRLTGRTGEVLCHPRPTLVRWTILLLSANRDPVTYRPNINNRASTLPPPPSFLIWKSKPAPPVYRIATAEGWVWLAPSWRISLRPTFITPNPASKQACRIMTRILIHDWWLLPFEAGRNAQI